MRHARTLVARLAPPSPPQARKWHDRQLSAPAARRAGAAGVGRGTPARGEGGTPLTIVPTEMAAVRDRESVAREIEDWAFSIRSTLLSGARVTAALQARARSFGFTVMALPDVEVDLKKRVHELLNAAIVSYNGHLDRVLTAASLREAAFALRPGPRRD